MRAHVITFIDEELDSTHRIYGDGSLFSKFMYVKSHDDIEPRIKKLKETPELVDKILAFQDTIINFDKDEWIRDFGEKIVA